MTENELRKKVIDIAKKWVGYKESNGSHKKIIDFYNSYKPLARGYKVSYTDAWCATFASSVAIKAGLTDIIPVECGCEHQINLFKKINCWQEDDNYTPKVADYIYYDWDDDGVGDNKGYSDHVGIVTEVNNGTIKVIEGNINNKVGYRTIKVGSKGIRGYGVPNYASKVQTTTTITTSNNYNIDDIVYFSGCLHYTSAYKTGVAKACKAGLAKVTAICEDGIHSYHLKALAGKGATVYGWVNPVDIIGKYEGKTYKANVGDTLTEIAKKYDTTVEKLAIVNNISNPNKISIGQIIKIV